MPFIQYNKKNNHLCVIINRDTKEELASYIIEKTPITFYEKIDEIRSARFNAIDKFNKEFPQLKYSNFYCDSVEI